MKRAATRLLCGLLLGVLGCGALLGQGSTAQISGTVTDPSGAVLPGVEITATQTETAGNRTTVSNETGAYVLPNLPVGPYRLEAALPMSHLFVGGQPVFEEVQRSSRLEHPSQLVQCRGCVRNGA